MPEIPHERPEIPRRRSSIGKAGRPKLHQPQDPVTTNGDSPEAGKSSEQRHQTLSTIPISKYSPRPTSHVRPTDDDPLEPKSDPIPILNAGSTSSRSVDQDDIKTATEERHGRVFGDTRNPSQVRRETPCSTRSSRGRLTEAANGPTSSTQQDAIIPTTSDVASGLGRNARVTSNVAVDLTNGRPEAHMVPPIERGRMPIPHIGSAQTGGSRRVPSLRRMKPLDQDVVRRIQEQNAIVASQSERTRIDGSHNPPQEQTFSGRAVSRGRSIRAATPPPAMQVDVSGHTATTGSASRSDARHPPPQGRGLSLTREMIEAASEALAGARNREMDAADQVAQQAGRTLRDSTDDELVDDICTWFEDSGFPEVKFQGGVMKEDGVPVRRVRSTRRSTRKEGADE